MQKLTQLELNAIQFPQQGKKVLDPRAEAVYREAGLLSVGEGLVVTNEEWPNKTRPSDVPVRFRLTFAKYAFRGMPDKTGFVIIRTA